LPAPTSADSGRLLQKQLIWIMRFNPSVEDGSVKIDDKEAT